jgi:hypothetical protein
MSILTAYKLDEYALDISPLPVNRDWMDETPDKHAYRCFPVTLSNTVGWYFSYKKDIEFIWDGVIDTTPNHIKIIQGEEVCSGGRGQGTVSFNTGLIFRSDSKTSVMVYNPPNYFNPDFQVMSSIISTSFYKNPYPLAIRAISPNKNILIKAGTPIAAILPVSLSVLKEESIKIERYSMTEEERQYQKDYGDEAQKYNQSGEWTDWYRKAIDHKGESIGEHEASALKLKVIDNTKG